MHLEGTMNYSIAPLNEKLMQPNTSKHELIMAMQGQTSDQIIMKNQQSVINAIRNAKIRKTRNSNSKSIVSPTTTGNQPAPIETESNVVAILAAAQRMSNNKTTVEPGDLVRNSKNISLLKNSGLVLPSIDSNKFTLMPSYNDP